MVNGLKAYDGLGPQSTTSLQRDVMQGGLSELEAQIGAVVRLGRKPMRQPRFFSFIYHSLLPMELKAT
jgi:2-dehydropantoate 2-reductase